MFQKMAMTSPIPGCYGLKDELKSHLATLHFLNEIFREAKSCFMTLFPNLFYSFHYLSFPFLRDADSRKGTSCSSVLPFIKKSYLV